jgi:LPS export ABC transporter protein LptC
MGLDAPEVENYSPGKNGKFMILRNSQRTTMAFFFLYAVFFWVTGCQEKSSSLDSPPVDQTAPTQKLKKFSIVQTDNGQKRWEMEADEAEIYDQKKQSVAFGIRVKFFENNVETSDLSAKRGTMNSDSGDMEVEGNVVVNSLVEKTKIETTKLKYVDKEHKIFSDEFVRETRPDVIITGYGLEADPSLKQVVIKKDVKAEVIEKKKGQ